MPTSIRPDQAVTANPDLLAAGVMAMRDLDCSIAYRLWPQNPGPAMASGSLKEIGYQIRVSDQAKGKRLEHAILSSGIGEIRVVEGPSAVYEIVDVRSYASRLLVPWH